MPCHVTSLPLVSPSLGEARTALSGLCELVEVGQISTSTPTVVTTSCGTTLAVGRAEGCNGPGHARCVEGRAGERVQDAHLRTPCVCTTTLRHCDRKGRVARAEAVRNERRAWALWNDRSDVLLACSGHRLRGRTFPSRRQEDLSVVERVPDLKDFRRALRLHMPCSASWNVGKTVIEDHLVGKGDQGLAWESNREASGVSLLPMSERTESTDPLRTSDYSGSPTAAAPSTASGPVSSRREEEQHMIEGTSQSTHWVPSGSPAGRACSFASVKLLL